MGNNHYTGCRVTHTLFYYADYDPSYKYSGGRFLYYCKLYFNRHSLCCFFILFLYIWLWNTFGKTVLTIEPEQITVWYKNKLFTGPKTYLKKEIDQILVKNFEVEKYKLGVRYHFSLSGSTYSVVLIQKGNASRIIDWITENKASEITDEIKKMWY